MIIHNITSPLTGLAKEVLLLDDESIVFEHPLTKETLTVKYDNETGCYMFPVDMFVHIPLCTVKDAMEILHVSKMRISVLCSKGYISHVKVGNSILIDTRSLARYNANRKNISNG